MCGIVGLIGASCSVPQLLKMRDSMVHRGPDDAGHWISNDGRVGLAHRRLSILDLTAGGHQPLSRSCGDVTVIFNGEIYNFDVIRDELIRQGMQFSSRSDTEVIVSAYLKWGDVFLDRLSGMFALAIYDSRKQILLLARDRLGKKPLYYSPGCRSFLFSSELRAMRLHPEISGDVDLISLNHYLARGYVPRDRSMLHGVKKLLPGECLTLDTQTMSHVTRTYWHPPAFDAGSGDSSDLLERLGILLVDSVKQRLVADVPVGVLLSGGLDSSLIVAAAARSGAKSVKTFTIANPSESSFDESKRARAVALAFGTNHTELAAEESSLSLDEAMGFSDEPMADSSFLPAVMVSRLARRHITVALGGDGGDELFAGYGHYQKSLRLALSWGRLPHISRTLARLTSEHLPIGFKGRSLLESMGRFDGLQYTSPPQFFDIAARNEILRPAILQELGHNLNAPENDSLWKTLAAYPPISRYTRFDIQNYLSEDILVKVDRASMSASLEVRAPWLDHRMVEFVLRSVPDESKTTRSETRILQRRLAASWLPPHLDMRRKQGFSIPLESWLRGRWKDCLDSSMDNLSPYIKDGVVTSLRNGIRAGRANGQRWYSLALLNHWIGKHPSNLCLQGPRC